MSLDQRSYVLMPNGLDFVLTRHQVADILGISLRTLARMETTGSGPSPRCRVSDARFGYRASVISQYIQDREQKVGPKAA